MATVGLLLAGILLGFLPGCGGDDTVNISVEELNQGVRENLPNLHSYQTDIQMTMNAEGEVEGETANLNYTLQGQNTIDLTAKKSKMEMTATITGKSGTENIDQKTDLTNYIFDDISYTGTVAEGSDMEWSQKPASSSVWEEEQQSEQMIYLFENSEIKTLKAETVDGEQCFMVELKPDNLALWDAVMSQMGDSSEDSTDDVMGNSIKDTTVKFWFVQDTLFFKKVYIMMDIQVDATSIGASSGYINYELEMTIVYDNHNQSFNIVLPEEALQS
jgi:hypothetical protein